ncbi:AAA family ATPase [Nocardioides sp. B-3]|nr:AAA family ATPase [Nocardioides sp. B-3]UUZ58205.1 AAA family ATPase [Nocardioides sp. B-3]
MIEQVGRDVVATVGEKRATRRRANLHAEASRQTIGWRFATTTDREAVTGPVVDAAELGSLRLTPPELATTPEPFLRADGTSTFRPKHSVVFSSEQLLAAEDRLLQRADTMSAPTVDIEIVDTIAGQPVKGHRLSPEQAQGIAKVAVSGRQVDVLIGPAGAGKTTAMGALQRARTQQHGRGAVVGLAPSAAAARVLADDLGIACENTAKWLYQHERGGSRFQRGQLVIIDEATLAGTFSLDRITAHAAEAGAKVLLVGDWAQLQSVEAGGAFAMLADARDDAAELVDIHRFTHEWEKGASLDLRHGHPEAVDTYLTRERVTGGDTAAMIEAAYQAWRDDTEAGKASVPVTDNTKAVVELNARARAERLETGKIPAGPEVPLIDGTPRLGRRLGHHPQERPPAPHAPCWLGPQWRSLDCRRRPRRRLHRRTPARQEARRRRRPARRIRRRPRRPRLRHHRTPRPRPHRRYRACRRVRHHHEGKPVRRHDARPGAQPRLRHPRHGRRQPRGRRRRWDRQVGSGWCPRQQWCRTVGAPDDHDRADCVDIDRPTRGRVRDHRSCRTTGPLGNVDPLLPADPR